MTKKYHLYKIHSFCTTAGDHQGTLETYITDSPTTAFVSEDPEIKTSIRSVVEVPDDEVDILRKYIPFIEDIKHNTVEVSGLDLNLDEEPELEE